MNELDKKIAEINKKYKKDIIRRGTSAVYVDKIPFSSPRLNYQTYGGVPIGKATEVIGKESGGKTTTALDAVGNAQKKAYREWKEVLDSTTSRLAELEVKNNKSDQKEIQSLRLQLKAHNDNGPRKVIYFDLENTLDEEWAEKIGVDTDEMILVKPDDETAEQVLQMVLDLIEAGNVILVVIDSIPMLVSQQLHDEDLTKKSYGGIAGAVTEFCRKVSPLISTMKTALLIINQVREDFNNPYNQYQTPGGRALKHLYALRLFLRKGSFINEKNEELKNSAAEPAGNIVDVEIVKTKVCKPDRRVGYYTLKYDDGIDVLADAVDLAIKYEFIKQSGAWFYIMTDPEAGEHMLDDAGEMVKFQGRSALLEYLRDDFEVYEELETALNEKMNDAG